MKRTLALLVPLLLLCSLAPVSFADDTPVLVDAGAPSGSAAAADPVNGAVAQPAPDDTLGRLKGAYEDVKAKYNALKGTEGKPRQLAFAAMLAVGLKYLLDLVNALAKSRWKKQLAWVALALAVPIALFSRFAAGVGWFDALLYAGSGPGAIVVHELISRLKPSPAPAT